MSKTKNSRTFGTNQRTGPSGQKKGPSGQNQRTGPLGQKTKNRKIGFGLAGREKYID